MKIVFSSLAIILIGYASSILFAQENKIFASGFNYVNAIGLDTPTILKLNGNSYRPAGYKQGAVTQGGMLYEGNYQASIENSNIKPSNISFTIDKNSSPILLGYLKEELQASGEKKVELKLVIVPNREKTSKTTFWAMYAAPEKSLTIEANKQIVELPSLTMVNLGNSRTMSIKYPSSGDTRITKTFSVDSSGNYIIFFYPSGEETRISFLADEVMVVERDKNE